MNNTNGTSSWEFVQCIQEDWSYMFRIFIFKKASPSSMEIAPTVKCFLTSDLLMRPQEIMKCRYFVVECCILMDMLLWNVSVCVVYLTLRPEKE
jgi:hypothetical protein